MGWRTRIWRCRGLWRFEGMRGGEMRVSGIGLYGNGLFCSLCYYCLSLAIYGNSFILCYGPLVFHPPSMQNGKKGLQTQIMVSGPPVTLYPDDPTFESDRSTP
jgi:hypothetical protein